MTITFSQLGNIGHLGNQMFQYAALRGLADKHGYEWAIPPRELFGSHYPLKSSIYDCFELSSIKESNQAVSAAPQSFQERHFHFDEDLFNNCPDNIDIVGYFQSEKYFKHISNKIVDDFYFTEKFEKPFDEYISLHVRRGDYLNNPSLHPACSVEYYKNGLSIIGSNLPVVIFSDDIDWCKNNIPADYYSESNNANKDLFLMANATHNIIANSSFSWWGAWLNQNPDKIVVAPGAWVGPAYDFDTTDIVPKGWTII